MSKELLIYAYLTFLRGMCPDPDERMKLRDRIWLKEDDGGKIQYELYNLITKNYSLDLRHLE